MNINEHALHAHIVAALKENPHYINVVVNALVSGIGTAYEEANQRAMDFETIAMLAVTFNNSKKNNLKLEKVIQEKIKTHKKYCYFVWDSFLGEESK